jgi:hypothetical protein
VDTTETSKSSLVMTLGNPVTLIVNNLLSTGDTLLGVRSVTLVGAVDTDTDYELSVFPLTLTVREGVVEEAVLKPDVRHLIKVDEIETISHLEPSLKVRVIVLPSDRDCGKAEPVKVKIVPP